MQPFEFLIKSRPVSQQTRNRRTRRRSERLREWREFVKQEATKYWSSTQSLRMVQFASHWSICTTR